MFILHDQVIKKEKIISLIIFQNKLYINFIIFNLFKKKLYILGFIF